MNGQCRWMKGGEGRGRPRRPCTLNGTASMVLQRARKSPCLAFGKLRGAELLRERTDEHRRRRRNARRIATVMGRNPASWPVSGLASGVVVDTGRGAFPCNAQWPLAAAWAPFPFRGQCRNGLGGVPALPFQPIGRTPPGPPDARLVHAL